MENFEPILGLGFVSIIGCNIRPCFVSPAGGFVSTICMLQKRCWKTEMDMAYTWSGRRNPKSWIIKRISFQIQPKIEEKTEGGGPSLTIHTHIHTVVYQYVCRVPSLCTSSLCTKTSSTPSSPPPFPRNMFHPSFQVSRLPSYHTHSMRQSNKLWYLPHSLINQFLVSHLNHYYLDDWSCLIGQRFDHSWSCQTLDLTLNLHHAQILTPCWIDCSQRNRAWLFGKKSSLKYYLFFALDVSEITLNLGLEKDRKPNNSSRILLEKRLRFHKFHSWLDQCPKRTNFEFGVIFWSWKFGNHSHWVICREAF